MYFSGKLWLYFYKTIIFYSYLYNFFIISSIRGELFVNFGKLILHAAVTVIELGTFFSLLKNWPSKHIKEGLFGKQGSSSRVRKEKIASDFR